MRIEPGAMKCPDCTNGFRVGGDLCETCLGTPGKIIVPEPKKHVDPYRLFATLLVIACGIGFTVLVVLFAMGKI